MRGCHFASKRHNPCSIMLGLFDMQIAVKFKGSIWHQRHVQHAHFRDRRSCMRHRSTFFPLHNYYLSVEDLHWPLSLSHVMSCSLLSCLLDVLGICMNAFAMMGVAPINKKYSKRSIYTQNRCEKPKQLL